MICDEDQAFWDRLDGMPLIEVVEELRKKRDRVNDGRVALLAEKADAEIRRDSVASHVAGLKIDALNKRARQLSERQYEAKMKLDRCSWKAAVQAIFGQDGYAECVDYMIRMEMFQGPKK